MRFEKFGDFVRLYLPIVSLSPDPLQYKPVSPVIQLSDSPLFVAVDVPNSFVLRAENESQSPENGSQHCK